MVPESRGSAQSHTKSGPAPACHRPLAAPFGDLLRHPLHKGLERLIGLVAGTISDVDMLGLRLTPARDRHIWHLPRLGISDLALHALRSIVHLEANPRLTQPLGNGAGVVVLRVGDRDYHHLHGVKPGRES